MNNLPGHDGRSTGEALTAAFPCDRCGLCCQHVDRSLLTAQLDRGDGMCTHFDGKTGLCKIYAERPLVCRVEDYFRVAGTGRVELYFQMNIAACEALKQEHGLL